MQKRGRKSASELSVAVAIAERRPEPPGDLPEAAQALWREIAATKPGDWWRSDTFPLLRAYVLHCTRARILDQQIDAMQPEWLTKDDGLKRMEALLRMRTSETKVSLSLARAMRLTQQARIHPVTAGRAQANSTGDRAKPWKDQ
jgi:hypothetical protein